MKRGKSLLALIYITVCAVAAVMLPSAAGCDEQYTHTDIIFSIRSDGDVHDILSKYSDTYTFENIKKIFESDVCGDTDVYYSAQVFHSDMYSENDLTDALRSDDMFGVAEADCELYTDAVPNERRDTYMTDQWYLDRTDAKKAWSVLDSAPGQGAVVAVIDTGVNYTHPDIKNNMWRNEREYYGIPGYDDDGNGIVDDIYGADVIKGTGTPYDSDGDGHGTHVAGIIAMTAGNGGGCGIAYGAKIMAVKAGDSEGKFKMSDVVAAVNYAVDMGADVINMSFGTYAESEVIKDVMEKASKKCILVAAAGNESLPNTESGDANASDAYPAAYPFVIGVMAEDKNGAITSWSNYDAEPHSMIEYEMSAPGYDILSTAAGNKYAYMSGTSMAAPMVSAAAVILYASADRDYIDDPVKYVTGQLTQAGTQYAAKTTADGGKINYKSLNIADALTTEPGINIEMGNIHFKDVSSQSIFRDEYTFYSEGKKELYCGFVVDNAWSKAEDVTVKVSSGSEYVSVRDADINIGQMDACRKLDLGCDADGDGKSGRNGAVSLTLDVKMNNSYTIPLTFEIAGKMSGKDDVICRKSVEKVITINVKEAAVEENNNINSHSTGDGITLTAPTRPQVESFGSYIDISWDNLLNAVGYYVYRSEKQGGDYRCIANVMTLDKLSYKDKGAKTGKKYYYKIKAYAADGKESPYSSIAFGIRLGKVTGLSYDRNRHNTKYENVLSWKKVSGAKKYIIYYSGIKSGKYKKLASTSKKTYKHRFQEKKTYYYKVRAYAGYGTGKAYGRYSKIIKVKR